jgi:hypothetical protein
MVEILPMLEYGSLYNKLNKDEPWDSPHNSKVLPQILEEAVCPSADRNLNDCSSNYMAVIGPGTMWAAEGTKKIIDFPNGIPYVVALVEVVNSGKHWAEPFAITVDELLENMRTGTGIRISSSHPDVVNILFTDAFTRSLPTKMPLSLWKRILDGERIKDEDLKHIDPNAPDMVDVYVGHNRTFLENITWTLSFLVWMVSAVLLFYRAVKSRSRVNAADSAACGGMNSSAPPNPA